MKYTKAMEREDYDMLGGHEDNGPQDPDLLNQRLYQGDEMNREIKFRQWVPRLKKYIGVWGSYKAEDGSFWNGPASESSSVHEQFTGLKDKNGKEIYEGDVIEGVLTEYSVPTMGVIQFSNEYGSWVNKNDGGETLILKISNIKILGNIFENPDLLK